LVVDPRERAAIVSDFCPDGVDVQPWFEASGEDGGNRDLAGTANLDDTADGGGLPNTTWPGATQAAATSLRNERLVHPAIRTGPAGKRRAK
jgi:hypothetical protein